MWSGLSRHFLLDQNTIWKIKFILSSLTIDTLYRHGAQKVVILISTQVLIIITKYKVTTESSMSVFDLPGHGFSKSKGSMLFKIRTVWLSWDCGFNQSLNSLSTVRFILLQQDLLLWLCSAAIHICICICVCISSNLVFFFPNNPFHLKQCECS